MHNVDVPVYERCFENYETITMFLLTTFPPSVIVKNKGKRFVFPLLKHPSRR